MKVMWAPWRMQYLHGKREKGCVFCKKKRNKKRFKDHIIFWGRKNYVVLNRYPYNNGHLMIIPYRHTADMEKLSEAETNEMMSLLRYAMRTLRKVYRPEGFNWGMNLGRPAGAGIAHHLHLHLIPRWSADTNFFPILSETRCLPQHLDESWRMIKKEWKL